MSGKNSFIHSKCEQHNVWQHEQHGSGVLPFSVFFLFLFFLFFLFVVVCRAMRKLPHQQAAECVSWKFILKFMRPARLTLNAHRLKQVTEAKLERSNCDAKTHKNKMKMGTSKKRRNKMKFNLKLKRSF